MDFIGRIKHNKVMLEGQLIIYIGEKGVIAIIPHKRYMKIYSLVCICQIYNELEKGNLVRFVKYANPLFDALVIYDDHSTDGSFEYISSITPFVIRGKINDFSSETDHKRLLLEEALKLKPDYIFWLDADEVISKHDPKMLQQLCAYCEINKIDGLKMKELNIWRSNIWRRIDSLYDEGWFVRLWRVSSGLRYEKNLKGLHNPPYPTTIKRIEKTQLLSILHYGFSTERNLAYKYAVYRSRGQEGYNMLERLISEEKLLLTDVPKELFPEGLYVEENAPSALTLDESLFYVKKYENDALRPTHSIICLIYKSIEWLKFVYEQVHKYTDLTNKEFFFVANDASDEVIKYLEDNFIPHYRHTNSEEHRKQWYINNVYRAYNFGAEMAQGEYLVFINSDMAFSDGWLEYLAEGFDGFNCLVSRLVESGKLRSGKYGVEKNFGVDVKSYREVRFTNYAKRIAKTKVIDGGLYMPLYIKKSHFDAVNGYPEGNIKAGSDYFVPEIAEQGESLISGDKALMAKLASIGVKQQTAFNSIVYHFQCGEIDSKITGKGEINYRIALCNDLLTGTMGEKVLWDYLLENIPSMAGVDIRVLKSSGNYSKKARVYIEKKLPEVCMIIQNASFIGTINPYIYTISFLQDDLRGMKLSNSSQEETLSYSKMKVANSHKTTQSYPDYSFNIIPIGINTDLFKPIDKTLARSKMDLPINRKIGIFVGSFSEIKGWDEVLYCIRSFPEIYWIAVTKYDEVCLEPNLKVYSKINQEMMAVLYNCADFFILGSKVETQCLAALEACLCDTPVVMHETGIFMDWEEVDRNNVGVFTDDLKKGVNDVLMKNLLPRVVVLDKLISIDETIMQWKNMVCCCMKDAMQMKYNKKIKAKWNEDLIKRKRTLLSSKFSSNESLLLIKVIKNIKNYIKMNNPKLYKGISTCYNRVARL